MDEDRQQEALLNALLTEHFVLQSARGATISESTARASVYLSTVSSSLVAVGFFATVGDLAVWVALGVLPALIVLGEITFARVLETSVEDVALLRGIQRIRRYYGGLAPRAGEFFPVPGGSAAMNEMVATGAGRGVRSVLFTLATAVAVVNALLAAGVVGVLLTGVLGLPVAVPAAVAAVLVVVLVALHVRWQWVRFAVFVSAADAPSDGTEPGVVR